MAKNTKRKNSSGAKKVDRYEAANRKQIEKLEEREKKDAAEGRSRDVVYQVRTKRDDEVIKAYITFNYRVFHPGVTGRLIFFGILVAAPAIIAKAVWLKAACLVIGAILILLGLFRQNISLALTKSKDEAYKNGTEFTYEFTPADASFYTGDKRTSAISKYKDITAFYYDSKFYYLGIRNRDFFILPKSRFTIGDQAEFEDFIYRRSKRTCKWLPEKLSDQFRQRRAARQVQSSRSDR